MEATRQEHAFALYRLAHNTDPEEFARLRAAIRPDIVETVDAVILHGVAVKAASCRGWSDEPTPADIQMTNDWLRIAAGAIWEADGNLA